MRYVCPRCGAPVAERAAECPTCGFAFRPGDQRPVATHIGTGNWSAARVLRTLLVVAAVFVLALLALAWYVLRPPPQVSVAEKEREGVLLLRQVRDRQEAYHDGNGEYAASLDALRSAGWEEPGSRWYSVRISGSGPAPCLEADPTPVDGEAQPRPLSMSLDGFLYRQGGCSGPVDARGTFTDPH